MPQQFEIQIRTKRDEIDMEMTDRRIRNQSIELARVFAAFGIVAYHEKVDYAYIPYMGLIFFLILSPYLDFKKDWSRTRSIRSLAIIFLVPWLFWMIVYGVLNVSVGNPIFPVGQGFYAIMAGTSLHLWFLPAMFLILVMTGILKNIFSPQPVFWCSVVVMTTMLASSPVWATQLSRVEAPYVQWIHALPAVFTGAMLGISTHMPRFRMIGYIALGFGLMASLFSGIPEVSFTYPMGIFLTISIVYFGYFVVPHWLNVQSLADCTLGIYLSHIIWLRILNRILERDSYLTAIAAFCVALTTVWIARKYSTAARFVLG